MHKNFSWIHICKLSVTTASNRVWNSTAWFAVRYQGLRNPFLKATVTHLFQSAYLLLYTELNKTSGVLCFLTLHEKHYLLCDSGAGNKALTEPVSETNESRATQTGLARLE